MHYSFPHAQTLSKALKEKMTDNQWQDERLTRYHWHANNNNCTGVEVDMLVL